MFSWARKLKKKEGVEENNITTFKGSVRYIFASLFFRSKKEYFWNEEKCFFVSFQKLFSFSKKLKFKINV